MDVARPVLCGLENDRVDEADERYVGDPVVGFEVVDLLRFLRQQCPFFLQDGTGAEGLGGAGKPADLVGDVLTGGNAQLELEAGCQAQLIDRLDVAGRRASDSENAVIARAATRGDALEGM